MNITIYRGTQEIGGILIELKTAQTRLFVDAGYPLFLKGQPIDDSVARLPADKLLELGVLPGIAGLYAWDEPDFDAVVISHAHIDHYGLLKYLHPAIPVWLSEGTQKIIELSQRFRTVDSFPVNARRFRMYEPFTVGDIRIRPYLMDHSAFDAAAFEFAAERKTVIYSGDFRGHGRKAVCLDRFIRRATKQADVLLTEGTMLGRPDEAVPTEDELQKVITKAAAESRGPVLFQCSSQNIDRLVTFYKAALSTGRLFVVDVYTANVLHELHMTGTRIPYPSRAYPHIRVFYPKELTQKIFDKIGEEYARRFSPFWISREQVAQKQENIMMNVRPSMQRDIAKCGLHGGLFIYSLWDGYRGEKYQQDFEAYLQGIGFSCRSIHTSGHAAANDIQRMVAKLDPKKIVPVHTMDPQAFRSFSDKVVLQENGKEFAV